MANENEGCLIEGMFRRIALGKKIERKGISGRKNRTKRYGLV